MKSSPMKINAKSTIHKVFMVSDPPNKPKLEKNICKPPLQPPVPMHKQVSSVKPSKCLPAIPFSTISSIISSKMAILPKHNPPLPMKTQILLGSLILLSCTNWQSISKMSIVDAKKPSNITVISSVKVVMEKDINLTVNHFLVQSAKVQEKST